MEIRTSNDKETKKIGKLLAQEAIYNLENKDRKKALVFALKGDLGAGKTTFTQGFGEGLGLGENITSPTFVVLKKYAFKKGFFYHIDSYRLSQKEELLDLGFKEIISSPLNVVFIEWADKIKGALPSDSVWVNFEHMGGDQRKIIIYMD